MAKNFDCPNCGGSLEYPGGNAPTIECPYCGKTVIVPQELRDAPAVTNVVIPVENPMPARGFGWLVWLIVIIVACSVIIPLLGTFAGLGAMIWGTNQVFSTTNKFVPAISTAAALETSIPTPTKRVPTPAPTPTTDTHLLMKFGSQGTGPGHFDDARSIAVDSAGNIYVGDYSGGRVQVFDASGKFVSQFTVGNSKTLLFSLAADRKGTIYAVANGQIQKYEGATGNKIGVIQYTGGDRFGYATLLADGGLLAMWYEQRNGVITSIEGHRDDLVHFDASGKVVQVWPGFISSQTGDPELETEVAADGKGNLFALGGEFGRAVFKFTPEGKFVTRFAMAGDSADQPHSPDAIAVDSQSRVYLGESRRILVFDANGRYIDKIEFDGIASGLALNDRDELYVVSRDHVLKLVLNGK